MTRAPALYRVQCLPGMLASGLSFKTFTSVDAFDGYVGALRCLGKTVVFQSPAFAIVSGASA